MTTPRRVLLISMDGVRPDAIQTADTPTLDRLVREGAVSWTARTVMPCCTLPCHTSMLRGVPTGRHGVTSNQFSPLVRPVPSLIDVAKVQGKSTGFFYNWEQLRDLASPGNLDVSMMYGNSKAASADRTVADLAIDWLAKIEFDLLFVYFGWPDECGHRHGWMSPEYLEAIEHADSCIGDILAAIRGLGRAGSTTTLVTSDHGGHDRTHGTERDEDMLIPWILHGPAIRKGYTIQRPVMIYDTCVTLAEALGLQPSPEWDGAVIHEAMEG